MIDAVVFVTGYGLTLDAFRVKINLAITDQQHVGYETVAVASVDKQLVMLSLREREDGEGEGE